MVEVYVLTVCRYEKHFISRQYFTTDNEKSTHELISILKETKALVPPQLEEMATFGGGWVDDIHLLSSYFLFVFNFLLGVALVVIATIWEKLLMKNLVFTRSLDSLYIYLHRIYMNLTKIMYELEGAINIETIP